MSIGCIEQELNRSTRKTLVSAVVGAKKKRATLQHSIDKINQQLSKEEDPEKINLLVNKLGTLQHEFETSGGYDSEYEAKIILSGLGFKTSDFHRPLIEFSGGWSMRVELAKLLMTKPDLLLLDEPTNHLDLESCVWLENYLNSYNGAILIISHDREFLNHTVEHILALESDRAIYHHGDYDSYIKLRQKEIEIKEATAKRQERRIKQELRYIERFRYKATKASQIQSRIKRLQRIQTIEVPRLSKKIHFSFSGWKRGGEKVIELKNIKKAYGSNKVYEDLSLTLHRGDRVALLGHNGAGKTTLLKILAGRLDFEEGERILGYNISTAYYAQYQLDLLNIHNTVLSELSSVAPGDTEQHLRTILGGFLFSGDDVDKSVSVLSGGEKSRLAMAKLLVQPYNFLILDEPTNHLDIASREVLSDALEAYTGTLCFVTHDRTFIRQIANKMVNVANGKVEIFPGSYDEFIYWKENHEATDNADTSEALKSKHDEKSARDSSRRRKVIEGQLRNKYHRRLKPLEQKINSIEANLSALEIELKTIEANFSKTASYENSAQVVDTINKHRQLKNDIQLLVEEWEAQMREIEEIRNELEKEKQLILTSQNK
jgi:ATP-binding cassette subfamily F protein 3